MSIHRVLALMLGVWFTVYIGEPELLSPCPMHDAVALAGHAPATHAGHGGSPDASHAMDHDGTSSHDTSSGGHRCHCPGPCCGTSTAVAAPPIGLPLGAQLAASLARIAPTRLVVPAAVPHLLPFANGPPALALGASPAPSASSITTIG